MDIVCQPFRKLHIHEHHGNSHWRLESHSRNFQFRQSGDNSSHVSICPAHCTIRAICYREVSSGTYRKYVYALAVELAEIPFNLLMAIVSWVIFYWIVSLDPRADKVIYNLLMVLAIFWAIPLFGQLFSFLSPSNVDIASVIGTILLVAFTLTISFLISPEKIPLWWIWVYWINPLRYALQGLVVNELRDGKEYLNEATGGLASGDDLLDFLGGWSFSQRWWYSFGCDPHHINWMKH